MSLPTNIANHVPGLYLSWAVAVPQGRVVKESLYSQERKGMEPVLGRKELARIYGHLLDGLILTIVV